MNRRGFTPLEKAYPVRGRSSLTGFTLIELLITIAIIGILAGVAVSSYVGSAKKAARSEAYTNLGTIRLLQENHFAEFPAVGYAPAGGGTVDYEATPGVADNGLEDELPAFQPGGCTGCASPFGLNFTFAITQNVALVSPVPVPYDGTTAAQTPCFVAVATGVANTRVDGDVFAIDCNNIANFN